MIHIRTVQGTGSGSSRAWASSVSRPVAGGTRRSRTFTQVRLWARCPERRRRRVAQRLFDILCGELWVVGEDLVDGDTVSEQADHGGDRHARAANARDAGHDTVVNGDALEGHTCRVDQRVRRGEDLMSGDQPQGCLPRLPRT